jgi:hypothetical protein
MANTAYQPTASRNNDLDILIPPTGTFGYICLIDNVLTSVTYTVDSATNVLTTASDHKLVTGSRVRSSVSGGVQPNPLSGSTDYYAIVTGSATLKLATTLADALASTEIDLTDAGTGTLTLNEQSFADGDPLNVLINHEFDNGAFPDYARFEYLDPGVASAGSKFKVVTQNVTGTNPNITFKYVVVIKGGISTVRDITGDLYRLVILDSSVTATSGSSKQIQVTFTVPIS